MRRPKLNPFIWIVTTIFVSGYLYVGGQLILPLELALGWTLLLWLLFALPFALLFWLPLVYWRKDNPQPSAFDDRMIWASFFSMGLLSFLFFFVVVRDVFLLGARAWGFVAGALSGAGLIGRGAGAVSGWFGGPSRVPLWILDYRGTLIILALALVSLAIGFKEARRIPNVTEVEIPIDELPEGLQNLRIVQISDLHIGTTIQRPFVEAVVLAVNALQADIVALTGDIADGTVQQLFSHFEPLAGIQARLGRFFVTGNHEYYWDAPGWIEQMRTAGIMPLLNSHVTIEHGGARIVVAGIIDLWAAREGGEASDPQAALAGSPADAALRILLAHQPKVALSAASMGYHLQLSGHTHGGQFLPWTVLVNWLQPFARGLHRVGKMWVYVNRGTGYWGPPIRLGSPSEITLLKIVRA